MSHVNSRHYVKMQVYWPLVMVVSQRCKVWQRHAAHTKMELSVSSATNKCQRSQLYYIQSVTVLDEVALENTKSLSSNMVIMFACIVHDLVSSCAPLPVPSTFVKNCILGISHPCKAPISCTQASIQYDVDQCMCSCHSGYLFAMQHAIYTSLNIN